MQQSFALSMSFNFYQHVQKTSLSLSFSFILRTVTFIYGMHQLNILHLLIVFPLPIFPLIARFSTPINYDKWDFNTFFVAV